MISSNMYPLMKLKGHRAPLVHVAVVPGEFRAVSLDETGKMIWWDVRKGALLEENERVIQSLTIDR